MRLTMPLLAAVLMISAGSCTKDDAMPARITPSDTTTTVIPQDPYQDYISYVIPGGANYCNNNSYPAIEGANAIDFSVVFDSSCIYTNRDPVNQMDINKLMGFSDCNTFHQVNSARFGWNWMDGSIYLYAYCYNDSLRQYKTLAAVPLDSAQHLKLYLSGNNYIFDVNGKTDTMPRFCSSGTINGYRLLPYFGGDEPAPHEIRIRIKYW